MRLRWPFTVFYPSARTAVLLALAAPLALALVAASAVPQAWIMAPALGAALLAMVLLDALLAPALAGLRVIVPEDSEVGEPLALTVLADFRAEAPQRAPVAALALDPRLAPGGRLVAPLALDGGAWSARIGTTPTRRGLGPVDAVWLRWDGPLGLATRQVRQELDATIRIRPNVAPVRSPALQLFLRDAQFGMVARRIRGEGTEFEALAEYEAGMDRRRIDWKSSARHARLFAKEYETERNNQIVFAFDCGQTMSEPIGGLPRIDRAVTAALTTAWIALGAQDRVAVYGFAAKPQVLSPFVTAPRDFARLQDAAAALDYSAEQPNFTLALSTLAARLRRRSLVVVFSEFTDPTSAELMIESMRRLVERHRVIFVVMADAELAEFVSAPVRTAQDAAMAVTATTLQHQRTLVLQRLRRAGILVVEAPHQHIGNRLLDAYLTVKRAGSLG